MDVKVISDYVSGCRSRRSNIIMDVVVYSTGLIYTSVCASNDATTEDIENEVNLQYPTGIPARWCISKDKTFRTGENNPHPCEKDRSRQHYLLSC